MANEAWIPCPNCNGSGCSGIVSREMAIGGGDVQLAGLRIDCSTCKGFGDVPVPIEEDDD